MTFIDTNIIIDVFERDAVWLDWSIATVSDAARMGGGAISVVVVAELSRNATTLPALQGRLAPFELELVALDEQSAFEAGRRYRHYRRDRPQSDHARVLPDFFIGAQAIVARRPLATRDPRLYRRYFPDLPLIAPETHPHG